ncbi:hypothetical protein Tco_0543592 [Tanacetum coccineum]
MLWRCKTRFLELDRLKRGVCPVLPVPLQNRTGQYSRTEPVHKASFSLYPFAAIDAAIPDPTPEDLAVGNLSAKVIAKAEASQKRKASTSSATSSHVAKRTRSALAQSSGSTTRPNLFADNSGEESDDDDDACVEIPLITHIRSAADPASRNQGGGFAAPTAEGPSTRGKDIMTDAVVASSEGASHPRSSSCVAPSFKDISGDAIHRDFFPFSPGPYYATYPEGGVASNCEFSHEEWDASHQPTFTVLTKEVFKDPSVCKTVVDQFPTPIEMVWIEALTCDQLTAKISVLLMRYSLPRNI